jgi:hypothetical protein
MRFVVLGALVVLEGHAHAENGLLQAELRLGYGVSMGGGGGHMATRATPLNVAAIAALAIRDEPRVYAYGGLAAETLDRNTVGALGGVRLAPSGSPLRLAAGAAWWFAPYTLYGATASGGACWRRSGIGVCGDIQLAVYVAGSDLAEGRTLTQVQGVLGVVFDAL